MTRLMQIKAPPTQSFFISHLFFDLRLFFQAFFISSFSLSITFPPHFPLIPSPLPDSLFFHVFSPQLIFLLMISMTAFFTLLIYKRKILLSLCSAPRGGGHLSPGSTDSGEVIILRFQQTASADRNVIRIYIVFRFKPQEKKA